MARLRNLILATVLCNSFYLAALKSVGQRQRRASDDECVTEATCEDVYAVCEPVDGVRRCVCYPHLEHFCSKASWTYSELEDFKRQREATSTSPTSTTPSLTMPTTTTAPSTTLLLATLLPTTPTQPTPAPATLFSSTTAPSTFSPSGFVTTAPPPPTTPLQPPAITLLEVVSLAFSIVEMCIILCALFGPPLNTVGFNPQMPSEISAERVAERI